MKLEVFERIQQLIVEFGQPITDHEKDLVFVSSSGLRGAQVTFFDKSVEIEYVDTNSRTHRDEAEGPALTVFFLKSGERREIYYCNNQWHRDPTMGPASISYCVENRIKSFEYWKDGFFLSSNRFPE
jgi:agmatine/peptidylarginine deiminase